MMSNLYFRLCRDCYRPLGGKSQTGWCRSCGRKHVCRVCRQVSVTISKEAPAHGSCMLAEKSRPKGAMRIKQHCASPHPGIPVRIMRLADLAAQGLPLLL